MRAAAPLRSHLSSRPEVGQLAWLIQRMLAVLPGPLGVFFSRVGLPLRKRDPHAACKKIFPLPWLVHRGGSAAASARPPDEVAWCNLWMGFLNHMYGGRGEMLCLFQPSAAQARVVAALRQHARRLLKSCADMDLISGDIHKFLRLHMDDYRDHAGVAGSQGRCVGGRCGGRLLCRVGRLG